MKNTKISILKVATGMIFILTSCNMGEKFPNVIIILADDQGYNDLGCFGSKNLKTPNIDKMASEGRIFTSFYAASICSPSRAALLTSSYAPRAGLPDVQIIGAPFGLSSMKLLLQRSLNRKIIKLQ